MWHIYVSDQQGRLDGTMGLASAPLGDLLANLHEAASNISILEASPDELWVSYDEDAPDGTTTYWATLLRCHDDLEQEYGESL